VGTLVNVLYFTGAYRADSMVSQTHGDLVAALRDRGMAIEILTIGSPSHPQAMRTERDRHGTPVTYLRPHCNLPDRFRRAWSARWWQFAPLLS
jgi:hypothetical protein